MDCKHESWECSGARTDPYGWGPWHKCNDCDMQWGVKSEFGQKDQIGKCEICQVPKHAFVTKDSGKREEYDSGMRRDTQEGKPRFDLLLVDGVPFDEQFLTRLAALLERGATKYGEKNWQLANSEEELLRFRASGLRHMYQWLCGEDDEDHAAAVVFNLMAAEYVKWKLANAS